MRGRNQIPPPPTARGAVLTWTGTRYQWVVPRRDGLTLQSDDDQRVRWARPEAQLPRLSELIAEPRWFTHFFGTETSSAASATAGGLQVTTVGGGVTNVTDCSAARPGQVALSAGTTSAGRTAIHTPVGVTALGDGRAVELVVGLRPTALSNGTDRYVLVVGMVGSVSGATQNYACAAVYDEGNVLGLTGNSARWRFWTKNNPDQTVTDTGVTVSTSFDDLRFRVSADGTLATLSINGVVVAEHANDIPTGTGNVAFSVGIFRNLAGTTAQVPTRVDYLGWAV